MNDFHIKMNNNETVYKLIFVLFVLRKYKY